MGKPRAFSLPQQAFLSLSVMLQLQPKSRDEEKKKKRRYASNRTAQSNKHQVCIVFAYNVDAQSDRFDQFRLNQGRIVIISHGFFSGSEANAAEWKS